MAFGEILGQLALSWGRIGVVGFGGGPAMIPLMKAEFVDLRGWQTEVEFLDGVAIASTLPGPIATKMSVYVGWQVAGAPGAAVSLLMLVLPSVLFMLGLTVFLTRFKDHPAVGGALSGVKPAVIALLAWVLIELAPGGVTDWRGGVIVVVALAALFFRVPPAIVMVGALAVGAVFLR